MVGVTCCGLRTVSMWLRLQFLTLGPTLGVCCHGWMIMTDGSLMCWGAALDGRLAQWVWRGSQHDWYISCLELMAVFLALRYFLRLLRGYYVLVWVDNTAVVT